MEKEHWTSADRLDGTYCNPLIFADVPDPDIIRAKDKEGRDAYYMVSTTMHMAPGVPIMKSFDLVNWQTVNYVYYVLEEKDGFALRNGKNDYASGSWASSLRQDEDGWFYIAFTCESMDKTYIFMTENIELGPWYRNEFQGKCYDNGMFMDEDTGEKYIFYSKPWQEPFGEHDLCYKQMLVDKEAHTIRLGEEKKLFHCTNFENPKQGLWGEGLHIYRRNGYLYIFAIQGQKWQRQEICWRGKDLSVVGRWDETDENGNPGGWVCRKVFAGNLVDEEGKDYMPTTGIAQGGIVDTPEGDWYCFLFEDYGSVGRIPMLAPLVWGTEGEDKDWPIIADRLLPGEQFRLNSMKILYQKPVAEAVPESIVYSDDFENREENYRAFDTAWGKCRKDAVVQPGEYDYNGSQLALQWQWNHNPDNRLWSLTKRPGYLRLMTGEITNSIRSARNTLTVRTYGPVCYGETVLDFRGMAEGDTAGLTVFQNQYGYAGVTVEEGQRYLIMRKADAKDDAEGRICEKILLSEQTEIVYLRAECDFREKTDKAYFYYALERTAEQCQWLPLGETLQMAYDWPDFVGYRFGLFCYASKQAGGYADFDYFRTGI